MKASMKMIVLANLVLSLAAVASAADFTTGPTANQYVDQAIKQCEQDRPRMQRMRKTIGRMMEILPPDNESSDQAAIRAFCKTPEMVSPAINFADVLKHDGQGYTFALSSEAYAEFFKSEIKVMAVPLSPELAAEQLVSLCKKSREEWMLFPKYRLNNIRTITGQFRDKLASLDTGLTLQVAECNRYVFDRDKMLADEQARKMGLSGLPPGSVSAKSVAPVAPKFTGICGQLEQTLGSEYDKLEKDLAEVKRRRDIALAAANDYVNEANSDPAFLVEYYKDLKENTNTFRHSSTIGEVVKRVQLKHDSITCDRSYDDFYRPAKASPGWQIPGAPLWVCESRNGTKPFYGPWEDRVAVYRTDEFRVCTGSLKSYVCIGFPLLPKPDSLQAAKFRLKPYTERDVVSEFRPYTISLNSREGILHEDGLAKVFAPKPTKYKTKDAYVAAKLAAEGCVLNKPAANVADGSGVKSVTQPQAPKAVNSTLPITKTKID